MPTYIIFTAIALVIASRERLTVFREWRIMISSIVFLQTHILLLSCSRYQLADLRIPLNHSYSIMHTFLSVIEPCRTAKPSETNKILDRILIMNEKP